MGDPVGDADRVGTVATEAAGEAARVEGAALDEVPMLRGWVMGVC